MYPSHFPEPINFFLSNMSSFIRKTSGLQLRPYQVAPIARLQDSIINRHGDTIIIVFPRQSGKDEFIIQLMAYLLYTYSEFPLSMVAVNPTYKPQTVNAIIRFDQVLSRNPLTSNIWRKKGEFMRVVDQARISFLSGDAKSNVVGATASLLLIVNEAQDINASFYQRSFHPMVASTHATRLLAGTLWTSTTFLSQEIRHAKYSEKFDNRKRLFMVDADHVRKVLPAYGAHVDAVISRWGRQHPLVKTQYFNEEIDATTGMFNAARMALIFGSSAHETPLNSTRLEFGGHSTRFNRVGGQRPEGVNPADSDNPTNDVGAQCLRPEPVASEREHPLRPSRTLAQERQCTAFLLDLAGQDESVMSDPASKLANPSRDSAALSIAEIDTSTVETLKYPSYRIIHRVEWTGQNHLTIFGQLKNLAENWQPRYIVVDATGVGEGLWALLDKAFPGKVIPVKFTSAVKSEIGYRFLALINTGRFSVSERHASITHPDAWASGQGDSNPDPQVEAQYLACQSEVLPGPNKTLRWGVPEGTRDIEGNLIHDDYVLADALVTQLDDLDWTISSPTLFIDGVLLDHRLEHPGSSSHESPGRFNRDTTDLLKFIDHNY